MTLRRVYPLGLLVGALAIIGCGSDNGGSTGNGGSSGSSATPPSSAQIALKVSSTTIAQPTSSLATHSTRADARHVSSRPCPSVDTVDHRVNREKGRSS